MTLPLLLEWEAVPDVGIAENVAPSSVRLTLKNTTSTALKVELEFEIDAATTASWKIKASSLSIPALSSATRTLNLDKVPLPAAKMLASGRISAWATVQDAQTGARLLGGASPPLFWHYGTKTAVGSKAPGVLTVYDELSLEQVYRGGDLAGALVGAPASIPDGEELPGIPSRVFQGDAAIVSSGFTTPLELGVDYDT